MITSRKKSALLLLSTALVLGVVAASFAASSPDASLAASRNDQVPAPATEEGETEIDEMVEAVGTEFLDSQDLLSSYHSWILAQPGRDTSGFLELVYDADNLAVTLLWSGEDDLLTASLAEASKRGIEATVEQRPLSEEEVIANSIRVMDHQTEFEKRGFKISYTSGIGVDTKLVQILGEYVGSLAASKDGEVSPQVQKERDALVAEILELAGPGFEVVESDSELVNFAGKRSTDA